MCSTGFGECLNDEPSQNLAYQYQFSDYPPTIDRRRSAGLYTKGPVYQKLPGNAYTADQQCAQTFEHETRRCPYMVSCLSVIRCFTSKAHTVAALLSVESKEVTSISDFGLLKLVTK